MTDYETERRLAELAVQRACLLTTKVFNKLVSSNVVTKDDKSPVTIADYGAQALVIAAVAKAFPADHIVGEEDSSALRDSPELRDAVWELVRDAQAEFGGGELGRVEGVEEMLEVIDRGTHEGGRSGRIWVLDPIDGTKGFLRGQQYAVCLGLLVDGIVTVGALGCPNYPVDVSQPDGPKGVLESAIRGKGAVQRGLAPTSTLLPASPIGLRAVAGTEECTFVEGVEAGHSKHDVQASIARRLGITRPSVRLDSQTKYAALARGDADIYLRLPTRKDYEEKIWDHAAGSLIATEAGGKVGDVNGTPLDFGAGRSFKETKGVIVAPKNLFDKVIEAVKEELAL